MSGVTPLSNQDNAYRAEHAGMQQAAEEAKHKQLEEDSLRRTQKKNDKKGQVVGELEPITEIDPDEKKEKSGSKKNKKNSKGEVENLKRTSLRGGGLLDTLAE